MPTLRSAADGSRLIPSHIQLKQVLLARIEEAEAPFRLPSIRSLMKTHRVSQTTVEKALMELERDGLIERRGTVGIFARPGVHASPVIGGGNGGLIGIIVHDLVNFFPPIVQALRGALHRRGFQTLVYAPEAVEPARAVGVVVDALLQNEAVGAVVVPRAWTEDAVERLLAARVPVVALTQRDAAGRLPCVRCDDVRGGQLAAEHLLAVGHRRAALCGGLGSERMRGFRECFETAGGSVVELPRAPDPDALRSAVAAGTSACFAYNDVAALELYWLARGAGLRVPDDLSLMGYDDAAIIRASGVELSTIAQPAVELGERAGRLLLEAMANEALPSREELLPPELVLRATTGASAEVRS